MIITKRQIFKFKQYLKDAFGSLNDTIECVRTFNEEQTTDIEKDLMFCCVFQDEDIQDLKEITDYLIETNDVESAINLIDGLDINLLRNYIVALAKKTGEYEEKSNIALEKAFFDILDVNKDILFDLFTLKDWIKDAQQKTTEKREIPTGKRGRPTRDITSKMIEDEDGRKLNKIRSLIKGKYGKDVALTILAAIKKGWMHEPTFKQVEDAFGNIGTRQGFKNYLDERKYTKEKLKIAIERLECD